jgi:hypothetical protein
MKVGDLVRWVLEDHELGVIVEVYKAEKLVMTAYKVYCLADNRLYNVYDGEVEACDENR